MSVRRNSTKFVLYEVISLGVKSFDAELHATSVTRSDRTIAKIRSPAIVLARISAEDHNATVTLHAVTITVRHAVSGFNRNQKRYLSCQRRCDHLFAGRNGYQGFARGDTPNKNQSTTIDSCKTRSICGEAHKTSLLMGISAGFN